jgi:hypothetical protein
LLIELKQKGQKSLRLKGDKRPPTSGGNKSFRAQFGFSHFELWPLVRMADHISVEKSREIVWKNFCGVWN